MPKSESSSSWWVRISIAAMTLSVGVAAIVFLRDIVERRYAWPATAPRVTLADRPAWMSGALAQQIIDTARVVGVHSVFDQQILVQTATALEQNPWIAKVRQVRRVYGDGPGDTLVVDCAYRIPTALVKWNDYYWLIDGDGYKLPAQYTRQQLSRAMAGADGKISLRVIQGITHAPVHSGKLWPGDDLAAGLELVKLLSGKPFAEDVPIVDVSNFDGRRDVQAAQLVLLTRYGTQIRWGRPPSAKDYFIEVSTAQKLQSLSDIFQEMHRVDGGQPWIDIRFDQVTYPSPQQAAATDSAQARSDTSDSR